MAKFSKETQGILWTLLGCFCFPTITAIVRNLAELGIGSPQTVFLRNLTALSLLIPIPFLKRKEMDLRIHSRKLYFMRIIFGLISMMLWFYGLGKLPLATATALSFTTPLFVAIMAVVLLKEKMGKWRWSAVIIGFLGTLIILRPGADVVNPASFAVLGGCFFMSFTLIIVKKLTAKERPFNMMFHMHLWMAFFSIPLAFTHWHDVNREVIGWCYALALFSILGQYSLVRAYQLVDVTLTLPFDFIRLIVASVIAYIWFNEVPDMWAYIGAGVIIASSVFIAHREALARKKLKRQIMAAQPDEIA